MLLHMLALLGGLLALENAIRRAAAATPIALVE